MLAVLIAASCPAPQPTRDTERDHEPVTPDDPIPAAPEEAAPPDPRAAIESAVGWMSRYPVEQLRFDAAIGLHEISLLVPGPAVSRARDRAITRASADDDNPMLRIWNDEFRVPREQVHNWRHEPGPRINSNRVIAEALHCSEHGWRDQTEQYATGAMRDEGGYGTTHAVWALTIAQANRCRDAQGWGPLRPLAEEMKLAQDAIGRPQTVAQIDLFAERTLMYARIEGAESPSVEPWIDILLALQNDDGSWGEPDQRLPRLQFHATMVATWALAAYVRRPH